MIGTVFHDQAISKLQATSVKIVFTESEVKNTELVQSPNFFKSPTQSISKFFHIVSYKIFTAHFLIPPYTYPRLRKLRDQP